MSDNKIHIIDYIGSQLIQLKSDIVERTRGLGWTFFANDEVMDGFGNIDQELLCEQMVHTHLLDIGTWREGVIKMVEGDMVVLWDTSGDNLGDEFTVSIYDLDVYNIMEIARTIHW